MPTLRDVLRHVIYRRLSTVRVEDVTAEDFLELPRPDADGAAPRSETDTEIELDDGALAVVVGVEGEGFEPNPAPAPDATRLEESVDVQAAYAAVTADPAPA